MLFSRSCFLFSIILMVQSSELFQTKYVIFLTKICIFLTFLSENRENLQKNGEPPSCFPCGRVGYAYRLEFSQLDLIMNYAL